MSETLPSFLKSRSERNFRNLLQQLEGVTPEEAIRDRYKDWPEQRWGVGQDGSIAGIVHHVAAWKTMTLPLFQPGGVAQTREEFEASGVPTSHDWPDLRQWLETVGQAWNETLDALPEAAFDEESEWDGVTIPLRKIVVEIMEHDIQHASQIEYLRQLHRVHS